MPFAPKVKPITPRKHITIAKYSNLKIGSEKSFLAIRLVQKGCKFSIIIAKANEVLDIPQLYKQKLRTPKLALIDKYLNFPGGIEYQGCYLRIIIIGIENIANIIPLAKTNSPISAPL